MDIDKFIEKCAETYRQKEREIWTSAVDAICTNIRRRQGEWADNNLLYEDYVGGW